MIRTLLQVTTMYGITTAIAFAAPERSSVMNPEYKVHKGLVYSHSEEELKLDLFLPKDASPAKPVPCIVVIQGGGFNAQNGQRFRPHAEYLAQHGFGAALIAYRGRPKHTYRDTVADTKTAVRFIRKVSGDHGIDPNKIGVMGSSAGATLAVLLAVTGGVDPFEREGDHSEYSSHIQSAVGISGVYDFVARFQSEEQRSLQPKLVEKKQTNGEWIGAPYSPVSEHWIRASAINHLDIQDPPVLLLHSRNDTTVPWIQSENMYKAMIDAGIESVFEMSDEGGHSGPASAKERMVDFFRNTLAKTSGN